MEPFVSPTMLERARDSRNRSGNVAILTALTMPVLVVAAAFAIDQGSLFYEKREAQSITDLAAMSAAANIAMAEKAAHAVLRDNHFVASDTDKPADEAASRRQHRLEVIPGKYTADPKLSVYDRFQEGVQPYNAVRVTLTKTGRLYFGASLIEPPLIKTTSVATSGAMAAFSIGSRLARLEGGVVNALLTRLVGTDLSVSVMDYEALASADIELFSFFDALAAEMRVRAVSYDELLDSKVSGQQFVKALSKVSASGQVNKMLARLAGSSSHTKSINLSRLIDFGPFGSLSVGHGQAALAVKSSVWDLLTAAAVVADGRRQIGLELGGSLPDLAKLELDISIGEPAVQSSWLAIGETGEIVRTSQMRLRLLAEVGGTGPAVLSAARISLPLSLDLAYAEARLSDVACRNGEPKSASVSVDARPGIAHAWIGESVPAELLKLPHVTVTGSARIEIGSDAASTLRFNSSEIDDGVTKTVTSRNVVKSLYRTLIEQMDIDTHRGGIAGSSSGLIAEAVRTKLYTVAPTIDSVLEATLGILGVSLGEADVRVTGVRCQRAVLVQ